MRYLLTAHPGAGHVYPIVALALHLRDAGEEVAVATGAAYRGTVESAGLTYFPAGPNWDESKVDPPEEVEVMWVTSPPDFATDLLDIARQWRPQAIVREESEMAGWIVADALGLPHAALSLGLVGRPDIFPPAFHSAWNAVRKEVGAFDDPEAITMHRYLYLDQFPADWVPASERPSAVAHSIGAALDYHGRSDLGPLSRDRSAHVYCTFGTVYNRRPRLLATLLESLSGLEVEATVSVGLNVDPGSLPAPANVTVERFVPQFEVLEKSSAVVCHGGMGTVLAALVFGLPIVAIPLGANQDRVAKLASAAGTALTVGADSGSGRYVDTDSLGPSQISGALQEVMSNPSFRERAERVGGQLRDLWSSRTPARLLRQLAESGEPVLSIPSPRADTMSGTGHE